jgi:hypothetical protein
MNSALAMNIILYAAENPARDLVSGGAAQALILNQRLSPRMLDAILATRAGFSPQKTEEPRSENDPDNLYAAIQGHDTARNGFRALSRSLYNWLQMHPVVRRGAAVGTAIGLLAALQEGRRVGRGSCRAAKRRGWVAILGPWSRCSDSRSTPQRISPSKSRA